MPSAIADDRLAATAETHSVEYAQEWLTVEEFGRRIGMSARNIRALQGRGLLPPPRRRGRRAFYLELHVQRAEAIKELQRRGFNLAAIGPMLGTGENEPETTAMAAMLERLGARRPALVAALARHRIVARTAAGELRVIRPKAVRSALALREVGVPLPAAMGALVAVLDAAEPASRDLLRMVHGEIVDNWDSRFGSGLEKHSATRARTVVTLLSEAERVVLENAGADLGRGTFHAKL